MPLITYIEHDGTRHEVDVPDGESVMQGAVNHMIKGIAADCGGALACATCHCYVDESWTERIGAPSEPEQQMLEFVSSEARANSRLSCQITVNEALNGLVVHLPETQF